MSGNNKRSYSKSARERAQAKRQAQLSAMRRNVTIFALLVLLVVGLVSTTFSSVMSAPNADNNGSLIVDVKNSVVAQNSKLDLADTSVAVDNALTSATPTKLYLTPNSNWKSDGARFAAYFYGNGETWVSMTQVDGETDLYECAVPSGYPNVIFCRMNPSATANNWNNKWNQSSDLTIPTDGNNKYTVNSGTWDKGGGTWSVYTPVVPTEPPTAPPTEPIIYETVYVGVVEHIKDFVPTLHYWNNTIGLSGDASLTATGTTVQYSVGSTYWNDEAQTFKVYTAEVPSNANGYKLFSAANRDKWAAEDAVIEDNVILLYWEWGGTYHNATKPYSTEVTATFKDYAGNVIGDVQTITNGSTPTAPADSAVPTLNGYKFTGWDPEVGPITVNTTYTAQYDPIEYTITYDNDGGTCSASLIKKYTIESETITLPDASKMTKIGYVFDGWYENGIKFTSIPKGSTGNRNFKAQWTKKDYNLTINNATGTVVSPTIVVKVNGNTVSATNNTYVIPHGSSVTVSINRATNTFFEYVKIGTSVDKTNFNSDYSKELVKVTQNYAIEYKLSAYKNFTLSRADSDDYNVADDTLVYNVGEDAVAVKLGVAQQLPYNVKTDISVTAPQGYYAKIFGPDGNPLGDPDTTYSTVTKDNKTLTTTTFGVTVLGQDVNYTVAYVKNPTIAVEQPVYGSIYITSGTGDNIKYYVNGQTAYAGTDLTVNVISDNSHCTIDNVYAKIDETENVISKHNNKYTFKIFDDTVVKADITIKTTSADENFSFEEQGDDGSTNLNSCEPGKRRIFFTENGYWGEGEVLCHYSQTKDDTDMSKNNITMTYKYTKTQGTRKQRVYYADIPANMLYVKFIYSANNSKNTNYSEIDFVADTNGLYSNAFYIGSASSNATLTHWTVMYSDYLALDRDYTAQQAVIKFEETAEFEYSHDYPGATLAIEKVDGNNVSYSYDSGMLSLKPIENTYDYSLIKVTSLSSGSVKYYLIYLSKITVSAKEVQKIFPLNTHITLSGTFSGSLLRNIQYNVSLTNFPNPGAYQELGNQLVNSDQENYSYSFDVSYAYNGVRYFKVVAKDEIGDTATVVQKTTFGTDNSVTNTGRMVYLKNDLGVDMSKYRVRACFESTSGKSWVTMQKLDTEDADYYRASVPDEYNYKVSIYLTHKNRYANIKSAEKDFKYICYYYAEDIVLPANVDYNPIYQIKELYSDRTMRLELQE